MFNKELENKIETLKKFVPVVKKVHGKTHNEFYEVSNTFDKMILKLNNKDFNLDNEFKELRKITSNYKVPSDTCETYYMVYKIFEELDKAYYNE